jgi:hypothetical protein
MAVAVEATPCKPIKLTGTRSEPHFPNRNEASMEAYDRLVKLVGEAAEDIQKAEGGNKAAGTRVRKMMQDIKAAAQDVRVGILQSRGAEAASG